MPSCPGAADLDRGFVHLAAGRGVAEYDGGGRRRPSSRPLARRHRNRLESHGALRERDRLPRRPRESAAATGSRPCWQGGGFGELAGLRDGNLLLEWALNLMVAERVDPQGPPRGVARGRAGESAIGDGSLEVGRFPALGGLSRKKMKAWLASDPGARPAVMDPTVCCRRPSWSRSASIATRQACPAVVETTENRSSSRPCSSHLLARVAAVPGFHLEPSCSAKHQHLRLWPPPSSAWAPGDTRAASSVPAILHLHGRMSRRRSVMAGKQLHDADSRCGMLRNRHVTRHQARLRATSWRGGPRPVTI